VCLACLWGSVLGLWYRPYCWHIWETLFTPYVVVMCGKVCQTAVCLAIQQLWSSSAIADVLLFAISVIYFYNRSTFFSNEHWLSNVPFATLLTTLLHCFCGVVWFVRPVIQLCPKWLVSSRESIPGRPGFRIIFIPVPVESEICKSRKNWECCKMLQKQWMLLCYGCWAVKYSR